jgi:integrase
MVSLRQDSRGNFFARKRLPDDVREEYGRLYGARFEAKFFVRASVGKQVAQQKFREWANEVEQRIEAIRKALRGEGIDLDREQATALAGEWYLWFVSNYEKEDADPEAYEAALWDIIEAMREFAPDEVREQPLRDMRWARDREVREGVRPVVADLGHTAQFLASRGLALTNKAQGLFLERVLDNYEQALLRLERRARGDYSPDKLPKTFSQFTKREEAKSTGPTPWELFAAWVDAKRPAQSTIESWRTVFNALTRDFPERSAASISIDEAQQWIDRLITVDRSAFTVRNTWSRATRAIYRWAIRRRKLTHNPFADVVVDVPRRKQHRPKWLYEHEYLAILKAASSVHEVNNPDNAAQRWAPWLLAYTGTRPGEIMQLRGSDVEHIEGVWTVHLTPEAGTMKSGIARRVPLHPRLVEQGFLQFVREVGSGPLFYRPRKAGENAADPMKQSKLPAAQAGQRLAAWVRKIGVDDKRLKRPNHAWRHTFKLIGRRIEPNDTMLDYICGHRPATVGRKYGEPELKDMARVIERFPRYEIN